MASAGSQEPLPIVIRAEASSFERQAAEELARYLGLQTGRQPRIEIEGHAGRVSVSGQILLGRVGDCAGLTPPDNPEGFRLVVTNGRYRILCGEGRGALYGVYETLERFGGCAWYSPRCEIVPKRDSFDVPEGFDRVFEPAFQCRRVSGGGYDGTTGVALKNKLSGSGDGGEASLPFDGELGACHTFLRLLDPAEHFAEHPEWFSEIGGERVKDQAQLCLTNPEVLRQCLLKVRARLRASYPKGVRRYGISANDWGNMCRCSKCAAVMHREGSDMGPLLAFVNAIADDIASDYPEARIQTLAYYPTRRPPKTIRPRKNVEICFCTIECDFAQSIPTSRARINREVAYSLRQWGAMTTHLSVWDYIGDYSCHLHPFPNLRSMAGNLQFYRQLGVSRVFALNPHSGEEDIAGTIRAWVFAHLLWNPDEDVSALLTRCCRDLFGPAAEDVRAAIMTLHEYPKDTKRFPLGCFDNIRSRTIPMCALDAASAHFDRALKVAAGTPYYEHVSQMKRGTDFARLMRTWARPGCPHPRTSVAQADFQSGQNAAREILAWRDRKNGLSFADDRVCDRRFEKILREYVGTTMDVGVGSGVRDTPALPIEEWYFAGDFPTRFKPIDDPLAGDGHAIHLPHEADNLVAWFDFRAIALKPNTRYHVRLRARVEGVGGPDDEVFRTGYYNRFGGRCVRGYTLHGREVASGGGYRWYTLGSFLPQEGLFFWFGQGRPCHKGLRHPDLMLDCIEVCEDFRK